MRIRTVVLVVVAACSSDASIPVDAPPTPDAPPGIDLFGEACDLPNIPGYPQTINDCHSGQGWCWDEDKDGDLVGTCRPWCDQEHPTWNPKYVCVGSKAGAVPTWTSDGINAPYVCVCVPP